MPESMRASEDERLAGGVSLTDMGIRGGCKALTMSVLADVLLCVQTQ